MDTMQILSFHYLQTLSYFLEILPLYRIIILKIEVK